MRPRHLGKIALISQVGLAIGERRHVHGRDGRQPPQDVVRANLVPAIGRKRQAMRFLAFSPNQAFRLAKSQGGKPEQSGFLFAFG